MSLVFLLLPFVAIRKTWKLLPRKPLSALYFIAIGLGFMFFEITMIQKLVLFLGYPTYSLTVTLSSLLIFVGIGALLSNRLQPRRPAVGGHRRGRRGVTRLLPVRADADDGCVAAPAARARGSSSRSSCWPRSGSHSACFMPLGVRTVAALSEHAREYVAWGWALNGFASVVGSILATILAMTYGFSVVLVVAFCVYLVAFAALHGLARRVPSSA